MAAVIVSTALGGVSLPAVASSSTASAATAAPAPRGDASEEAVRASAKGPDVAPPVPTGAAAALAAVAPVPAPLHSYRGQPEPFSGYTPQIACDPVARPGTVALRDMLKSTYGGVLGGITRPCSSSTTEHSEGRAYDWMLDADVPQDAERAAALIQWMVGPDADGVTAGNARRLGIMYIIWDRKIWGSYNGVWKAYNGASPHRDHVHFSLSWDGAMKRTSFWTGTTLTGYDYGPCRRYVGEPVPAYSVRNTSPCPTAVTRPATPPPAPVTPPPVTPPPAVPVPVPTGVSLSARWAALGGEAGVLGRATTPERSTPAPVVGTYRHFERGSLYRSPATDPRVVKGEIRRLWGAMGWERSVLGFPITDERALAGGAYNHFQAGSIYWSPTTGVHEVRGKIRDQWAAMGWERSALGYPTSDERSTPDRAGRYSHFQGGSIYWSPGTGAHEVLGAVRDRWAAMGWEGSALGYPTSRTIPTVSGTTTFFQGGAIRWERATDATTVEFT